MYNVERLFFEPARGVAAADAPTDERTWSHAPRPARTAATAATATATANGPSRPLGTYAQREEREREE
mgnify:CR=1 FL=1